MKYPKISAIIREYVQIKTLYTNVLTSCYKSCTLINVGSTERPKQTQHRTPQPMTYRELQLALKPFKAAGQTTIKLNSKKATLQVEYARLTAGKLATVEVPAAKTTATATTDSRQARINGLLEQLKANNRAELVNAAAIYAAASMAVRMLG